MPSEPDTLDRTSTQWSPCLEWTLKNPDYSGNPYDLTATATFHHPASGETRATGLFYDGGDTWKFRFTGTRTGEWTFTTASEQPALNGRTGAVTIDSNPNPNVTGFLTTFGNKWGWSALGKAFIPQLAMGAKPPEYHHNPAKIDADIQTFLVDHGFTGFHAPVFCRWFDIHSERYEEIESTDPNPDPRTFEALELLITRVNAAGGMVHIWIWGDNDANHHQTPMKAGWGGKNGPVDKRLQRYIAARLGPIPGWSLGYGFDLEHWVEEDDLREWHRHMHEHLGWSHLLGGRAGSPKSDTGHNQIYDRLDYAGYTHFRPTYEDYVAALETNPSRPVFSEDRFRVRNVERHKAKDYTTDMTRRGLYHSAMAGGVANIWGYLLSSDPNPQASPASLPYLNREEIKTCAEFFKNRFSRHLIRNTDITDGVCLTHPDRTQYLFYKEDAASICVDLSAMDGPRPAVAVDARAPYREIDLGSLSPDRHTLTLPHESDWAVAAGEF